jgi:trans-2-enoyl-CoA reductase
LESLLEGYKAKEKEADLFSKKLSESNKFLIEKNMTLDQVIQSKNSLLRKSSNEHRFLIESTQKIREDLQNQASSVQIEIDEIKGNVINKEKELTDLRIIVGEHEQIIKEKK